MAPLAVHLGPGRLGLGLVVEQLRRHCGFEVALVARPDGPTEQKVFRVAFADPTTGLVGCQVQWADNVEAYDDIHEDARARIEGDHELLITVALGGKVHEREDLIRAIVARRPKRSATLLLSCENEPHETYGRIAADHPEIGYCASVVDRICNHDEPERDERGRRCLLVHRVAQWVIVNDDRVPFLMSALDQAPDVLLVRNEELPAYKSRKLWIVNGVHMVLAMIARQDGHDDLPLTNARQEQFLVATRPAIDVILDAVDAEWGLAPDADYADDRVRAFCEAPDSAGRILAGRLVRQDLLPLAGRLNSRLGQAARMAHHHKLDTEPFLAVADLVVELLRDRSCYLPPREGPVLAPTQAVDALVVDEFRRFLQGWAGEAEVERLTAKLDRVLSAHRED